MVENARWFGRKSKFPEQANSLSAPSTDHQTKLILNILASSTRACQRYPLVHTPGLEATSTLVTLTGIQIVSSPMQVIQNYAKKLLTISKDNFLDQMVTKPTRITEVTDNTLDLFFCNNPSLVNRVEVIPGISDHEAIYAESSLRPSKTVTPPRKVHLYRKADFDSLKAELGHIKEDFLSIQHDSSPQELWNKFRTMVSELMKKYIPSKLLKGNKIKKPWIDRKVKTLMKRRGKLFTRMRKTKNETNVKKYKECKKSLRGPKDNPTGLM